MIKFRIDSDDIAIVKEELFKFFPCIEEHSRFSIWITVDDDMVAQMLRAVFEIDPVAIFRIERVI